MSTMEDDSQAEDLSLDENYGPALTYQMEQISQHKIMRNRAHVWAKELTFIVYDDEDDENESEDEDEETLLQKAIQMSMTNAEDEDSNRDIDEIADEDEGQAVDRPEQSKSRKARKRVSKSPSPDESDPELQAAIMQSLGYDVEIPKKKAEPLLQTNRDHQCHLCKPLPEFPDGKPQKFRLERSTCTHFLAVSYCWPKDKEGNPISTPQTYQYRKKDGTKPKFQPPDHIVDKAVAFARAMGLKQIWIDQICLPQDDSEDHQLGIQAIDIVYQRAHASVGLLESVVTEQRLLNAAWALMNWRRRGKYPFGDWDTIARDLVDFLDLIASDQWNTRAWILQEAFAAGHSMVLMVRTEEGIQFPQHVPVLSVPQAIPGHFIFQLDDIHVFAEAADHFLRPRNRHVDHSSPLQIKANNVLHSLQMMHPKPAPHGSVLNQVYVVGGTNFGARKACNAAVAITFLRGRKNWPPVDRLAIVANVCDYEVRLDTRKLANYPSLSIAYLTLAVMNGDMSLLNPDVYASITAPTNGFGWLPPFRQLLPSISSTSLQSGVSISLRVPQHYHITENGLKCPAILWQIDQKIDLSEIRDRWKSIWGMLQCYTLTIPKMDGESNEDHQERLQQIYEYAREYPENIYEGTTDDVLLSQNVSVEAHFNAMRVEGSDGKQMRDIIANIFVDILRHLYNHGNGSLANSVWESIRMDGISKDRRPDGEEKTLPDDVGDLITDRSLLSDPWDMFRFDVDNNNGYYQMWLVERIMRYGFVWAGCGVPATDHIQDSMVRRSNELAQVDENAENSPGVLATQKRKAEDDEPTETDEQESSSITQKLWKGKGKEDDPEGPKQEEEKLPEPPKSLLERAMQRQIFASLLKAVSGDSTDDPMLTVGPITELAMGITNMNRTGQAYGVEETLRQMVTFDVDGPCLVAIPIDRYLERLPHPPDRGMKVCWVVEPSPLPLNKDISPTASSSTHDMVKSDPMSSESGPNERFQVLDKVKGFWPLIENLVTSSYTFI